MSAAPGLFWTLAGTAMAVGSLHTVAPDHWVPFAAVSRARGWSAAKTTEVTLLAGTGHVSVSALCGAAGLFVGLEMIRVWGARMESLAGLLLVAFGLAYAAWGLRARAHRHFHGDDSHAHEHAHGGADHVHDASQLSALTLFLVFSADPCVAVIPLLFAAAPLGALRTAAVVLLYEAATLATMVALVLPARAGARVLTGHGDARWADAAAGGIVALTGVVVAVMGW